ncbi:MAG: hypothetical protein QOJ52_2408 [Acidimicrobiaceae bacterium]|nr:hypothetical protein [Acidimicrobiaceae bacterium]MDQ1420446.1 hypothetical protein [Acidimicrobiaceae bacterium]
MLGRPTATHEPDDQRLPKVLALPTFSADTISSTAYATEEILTVVAAGRSSVALGLAWCVPISMVVEALLAIVPGSNRHLLRNPSQVLLREQMMVDLDVAVIAVPYRIR